jgi:hypothetical protein
VEGQTNSFLGGQGYYLDRLSDQHIQDISSKYPVEMVYPGRLEYQLTLEIEDISPKISSQTYGAKEGSGRGIIPEKPYVHILWIFEAKNYVKLQVAVPTYSAD